jgi:hypothetical protein
VGANWIHVLDAKGRLRWEKYMAFRRGRVCGDFVCGAVDDLDRDGTKEIAALFTTSYPLLQVFAPDGTMVLPKEKGEDGGINIDVPISVAALDLFGGEPAKQIAYCGKSRIGFLWHDHKMKEQAGGKVSGSFVAMAHFQPDPAQPPMLVGADSICGVVGVRPRAKRNDRWINADRTWYRGLGEKITALQTADTKGDGRGEVYVGTKRGSIFVLDILDGNVQAFARLRHGAVTALSHDDHNGRMLAATSNGRVICVALE